jgi:hypothetical protein
MRNIAKRAASIFGLVLLTQSLFANSPVDGMDTGPNLLVMANGYGPVTVSNSSGGISGWISYVLTSTNLTVPCLMPYANK